MGIYDRDYIRDDRPRSGFASWSMVTKLIVINAAVWVVDVFFFGVDGGRLGGLIQPDALAHPWKLWQLVTSGFIHDSQHIEHLAFNMYALWLFGRDVEQIYGSAKVFFPTSIWHSSSLVYGIGDGDRPRRHPASFDWRLRRYHGHIRSIRLPLSAPPIAAVFRHPRAHVGAGAVGYCFWKRHREVAPGPQDNVAHLVASDGALVWDALLPHRLEFGVAHIQNGCSAWPSGDSPNLRVHDASRMNRPTRQ